MRRSSMRPTSCCTTSMVGAHHRETVERHVLDEAAESILHGVVGLEVVEMLGIDIGHDRDVGRQLEEGAVGLVRLHHHPVAAAEPRIGAVGLDDAAVDHGRIEIAGVEQRGDTARWSWSCRGCRRWRRSFSAASARPASPRAAPPAAAWRAPRRARDCRAGSRSRPRPRLRRRRDWPRHGRSTPSRPCRAVA